MNASAPATIRVFAYGSNMFTRRIRERCPSAISGGVAELRGYSLRWHKRSTDGSGKCDVVADVSARVYGVLFSIAQNEKPHLDKAEGLGNGYAEREESVRSNGEACRAILYYATNIDPALRPYTWYQALVVSGAREHGLPASYVDMLESTSAVEDPDHCRHERNMALLEVGHTS